MTDDPRRRMPEDSYWTDWRGNSEARRSADEPFEDADEDRGSWAEASRVTEPDEESFVSPGRYDPDRWEPGPAHWHSADAQHDIGVTPVADPRPTVGLRSESPEEAPRLGAAPVSDGAPVSGGPGRAMVRARRLLLAETLLVLALSLGQSAWYSILRMVERLTRGTPLSGQTSSLNTSVTPDRPWLDLTYQLSDIAFGVVPALLAVLLMSRISPPRGGVRRRLGLVSPGWGQDVGSGLIIAAFIGVPGLGLYVVSKELGLNTTVQAAGLHGAWWVVPVLILSAIMNAVLEETVMVGYLVTRWRQLGWNTALVVVISALIRGTYHLYQGWGGFVGNIVMGAVLGLIYVRRGRLLPLIVAHAAIDIVAFLGYTFLVGRISWLS